MSDPTPPPFNVWTYLIDHAASILAALGAFLALFKLRTIHIILNSRLTQLLKATRKSSRAEGRIEGQQKEASDEKDEG